MDYCEQGTLPSYEESWDLGGRGTMLTRGTTIVMESYQSTGPFQGKAPAVTSETSVGGASVGGHNASVGDDEEAALLDDDDDDDKAKGVTTKQRS